MLCRFALIWTVEVITALQWVIVHTPHTPHTPSQRSTVDELERESQTDELTVVISYLFMFAYITLFLGHIRSVATVLVSCM